MLINHTAEDCRRLPTTRHLHLINQYTGMFAITEFGFFYYSVLKSQCFSSSLQLTGCQTGLRAFLTAPLPPTRVWRWPVCSLHSRKVVFFLPFFSHVGEIGGGLQEVAVTMLRSWWVFSYLGCETVFVPGKAQARGILGWRVKKRKKEKTWHCDP